MPNRLPQPKLIIPKSCRNHFVFHASTPIWPKIFVKHSINCLDCGKMTKDFDTKEQAIQAWNRRTLPKKMASGRKIKQILK